MKKVIFIVITSLTFLLGGNFELGANAYQEQDYKTAKIHFEKACNSGDTQGCYNLGFMYANGQGGNQDYTKSAELYRKACDMEHVNACYYLGHLYLSGDGVEQNSSKALVLFEKTCDKGKVNACLNVGIINDQGDSVKENKSKALLFFGKACDLGDSQGCLRAGTMYFAGEGVEQNRSKAEPFFEKACDQGEVTGCFNVGIINDQADGAKRNRSKALVFFEKACDSKDSQGCYNAGTMYENGEGTDQNRSKAKLLFEKACSLGDQKGCDADKASSKAAELYEISCSNGDALGCFNLGVMYRKGEGVKQDHFKEVEYYRKGCDLGDVQTCYNLGSAYSKGEGAEHNDTKAAKFYQKACDGKYALGCYNLGVIYHHGIGIKKNHKKAKEYYAKACDLHEQEGCNEYTKLNTPTMTVVEASDIATMSPMKNKAISDNQWLQDILYGNDNDGAALRTVKIYKKNGKLRVNIENQFGFDCELTLDKKGRPRMLSNCLSQEKQADGDIWLVKEATVKLSCFSTKKEDICRGKYTLATSSGYVDGEREMTIAKQKRTRKHKQFVPRSSNEASFDCKKAGTLVEQAICSDPLLSSLDGLLAITYKKALKNSSDNSALKTAQRSWIKSKRNPCKNTKCLKEAYTSRISELSETVGYTAARFFEGVDKEYITTIDPISENQKTAILESGFLRGAEVCGDPLEQLATEKAFDTSWYVTGIENYSLSLGRCDSAQELHIKIYKKKSGGYLVAVESLMDGSGPKSSFTFFPISKSGNIGSVLTPDKIGMQVYDNEFISSDEQLPEEDNGVATLHRNDDGNIESSPWTWMEPKWENRNIVRKIWFEWNGEKFIKQVKKI